MMDMFGINPQRLDDAIKELAIITGASIDLLIEKGVFTEKEFNERSLRISAKLDQEIAKRNEETRAEFDKKYPGISKLFGIDNQSRPSKGDPR